jgi:hypothetical protein
MPRLADAADVVSVAEPHALAFRGRMAIEEGVLDDAPVCFAGRLAVVGDDATGDALVYLSPIGDDPGDRRWHAARLPGALAPLLALMRDLAPVGVGLAAGIISSGCRPLNLLIGL